GRWARGGGEGRVFFFSSRRRHTRLVSDWSSDVCSSDLALARRRVADRAALHDLDAGVGVRPEPLSRVGGGLGRSRTRATVVPRRSEERRVGKSGGEGGGRGVRNEAPS